MDGSPFRLWVTIPRTEEVYERHLGKGGARTVFVLQIHCKGAALTSSGAGAGSTQTWQLKKRYGYFERVHRVAARCATAASALPALPRRKLINHRDPKYLAALREELQAYFGAVIDLVASTGMGLDEVLQQLELPVGGDTVTWEASAAARYGAAADGRALPVEIEGFLRKQGGSKRHKERSWRERWFVLTGSSLHYYTHADSPTPKGVIELRQGWFGEAKADIAAGAAGNNEAFGIVLRLADGREVHLAAASLALRAEWLDKIMRGAQLPPSPPPPTGPRDKRVAQVSGLAVSWAVHLPPPPASPPPAPPIPPP